MRPVSVYVVSEGCAAVEALCAGIASDKTLRLTGRFRAIEDVPAAAEAAKPDVAVLDLSGTAGRASESIRKLVMRCGAPVVALGEYAGEALASLDAGAADFVLLPSPGSDGDAASFTADALERIRAAFFAGEASGQAGAAQKPIRLLALASAQGGPVALACILKRLPRERPAVLILQRSAKAFSGGFAGLLSDMCGCAVTECLDGMELEPGKVYLACDCGVTVTSNGGKPVVHAGGDASADALFASAAEALGSQAACVLVSGSGMEGLERAAALGALAIAQNKNALLRSVGFKLPGGVLEMPLEDIAASVSPCTNLSDLSTSHPHILNTEY